MKKTPQKVAYLSRNSVISENVAYRATVYRTGGTTIGAAFCSLPDIYRLKASLIVLQLLYATEQPSIKDVYFHFWTSMAPYPFMLW